MVQNKDRFHAIDTQHSKAFHSLFSQHNIVPFDHSHENSSICHFINSFEATSVVFKFGWSISLSKSFFSNFTRSCPWFVCWWEGRCLPGFLQPQPFSYGSCRTWGRKTGMWSGFECVSSHFVIRLSTSCLNCVCLDPPPARWWRNRPIPFLRFWSKMRMSCSGVKELTCSIEQGRRQWEDTKLRGEQAQPGVQIT